MGVTHGANHTIASDTVKFSRNRRAGIMDWFTLRFRLFEWKYYVWPHCQSLKSQIEYVFIGVPSYGEYLYTVTQVMDCNMFVFSFFGS